MSYSGTSNTILNTRADMGPRDKYKFVYCMFFLVGLVNLMPWSFFITAIDCWMFKFRDINETTSNPEHRTHLQAIFPASIMVTMQATSLLFSTLATLYGHIFKLQSRLVGSLLILLSLFSLLACFVKVNTDQWQYGFFIFTMVVIALINAVNTSFGISIYTLISNFPQSYMAPLLTGQGIAAVCNSILQICALATGLNSINSALIYFIMGIGIILLTLLLVILSRYNDYYKFHMQQYGGGAQELEQRQQLLSIRNSGLLFKKLWPSVVMMGTFMITSTVSTVASLVVSEGVGTNIWSDVYFVPVITFLLCSVCDIIGRILATNSVQLFSDIVLSSSSVVRIFITIQLIMLCNAQPRKHLPVVFVHDYQYIIVFMLYHITNGYVYSIAYLRIPGYVEQSELKNAYQLFSVVAGILMCVSSPLSFLLVSLL